MSPLQESAERLLLNKWGSFILSPGTRGKKDMIQQDIAEIMDKNKSAVLRSIDILEQKGFVKRVIAQGDRRKNIITLTDTGHTTGASRGL